MPKGGARTRSGPPPDPNALSRERDGDDWVELPAAGREGEVPAWPLPDPSGRELQVWAEEWVRPEAVMWERNQQHRLVALYVRRSVEAEERGSAVNLSTLVRQLMDDLGLTNAGRDRNKWRIAEGSSVSSGQRRRSSSSRDRLTVVSDAG